MYEVQVKGNRAAILTIEERDGVEYVIENDEVPVEYVDVVARLLGVRVRYLPPFERVPIKLFNDGIG